jgi:hypothetical protein
MLSCAGPVSGRNNNGTTHDVRAPSWLSWRRPAGLQDKQEKIMKMAIAAALLAASATAMAQDGYWENSSGQIWHNSNGECWRTSSWSKDKMIPGCDGMTEASATPAAKPVEAAPAPAPAPVVMAPADRDHDGVADDQDKCPGNPCRREGGRHGLSAGQRQ